MALTFTTGMTLISAADAVTNFDAVRFAGAGSAPGISAADSFKQGTGAVQSKLAGNNWNAAVMYDYYTANGSTTLDLTAAGASIIGVWVNYGLSGKTLARGSGGMYLIISSSTETGTSVPTAYSEYWLGGNDTYSGGWQFYLVDVGLPASAVVGTSDHSIIRRVGFGIRNDATVGTAKGEPFYLDAIWNGLPKYTVVGDGTTVAKWADFISHSDTAQNGLIQTRDGIAFANCGFEFGSGSQTATTTFQDSTNQHITFANNTYHDGAQNFVAMTVYDVYRISANGAASFKTTVEFGTVVGAGDDRKGVLGGTFRCETDNSLTWLEEMKFSMDFATNIANLTSVKLYGVSLIGASGPEVGLEFDDGNKTSLISCLSGNCSRINPGTTNDGAEILDLTVIDPRQRNEVTATGLLVNAGIAMYSGSTIGVAQSFTAEEGYITGVGVYLARAGAPTGNVTCNLYAHSGTFGSSSIPTGAALATATTVLTSADIAPSYTLLVFEFDGTYKLTKDTNYCLAVQFSGGDVSNYVAELYHSAGSAAGNAATLAGTTWTAAAASDLTFLLYVTRNRGLYIPAPNNIKKVSCITSGDPPIQHMIHVDEVAPATVSLDQINFFGSYATASLWHGESSGDGAGTITLSASDSNPTESEFEETGNPVNTVSVSNTVSVTFDGMRDNTEVRVYAAGTSTELTGIENATAGTTDDRSFVASIAASTSVDYTLVNEDYEIIRVEAFTWPTTVQTINVQQRLDRNFSNPV